MNAIEAQFVTPTLVGKSLSVNPLLVFVSLVFWLWLWGPIGGIIAIPLLIWTLTVVQGFSDQVISDGTPGSI
jgi:predicted PurR-regulated permease PerM